MKLTAKQSKKLAGKSKECKEHEFSKCEVEVCQVIYCSTCNEKCPYCILYSVKN